MSAEINRTIAIGVLGWCRDAGVQNVILCAGARNAPLIIPVLENGDFQIWNHFDERAASFFALGLAKFTGKPTAVITTSGTAVAECFPAVIEAHYSAVPLIVISADRPRRFRGSGAPQAIEQKDIYGDAVEAAFDIEDKQGVDRLRGLRWTRRGPLHLNLSFDEPLTDQVKVPKLAEPKDLPSHDLANGVAWGFPEFLSAMVMEGGGVVLLGEIESTNGDRRCVMEFTRALGVPVFAEAQSGLRESSELRELLIRGGDEALKALQPKFVLRIGGVPSCRYWRDLEDLPEAEIFSVTGTGFSGLAREARVWETELKGLAQLSPPEAKPTDFAATVPSFENYPASEPAIFRWLSETIPSEANLFLGNSLPIREWNLAATTEVPHPNIFVSRGVNGIDGQVSTFLGIVAEASTECWGIFGDLTSLYDLNAPWVLAQIESDQPIRIVVVNNSGGRIFSNLPTFSGLSESNQAMIENRHPIDFEKWAAMWDLGYLKIEGNSPMGEIPNRAVIEIVPDAAQTEAFYKATSV